MTYQDARRIGGVDRGLGSVVGIVRAPRRTSIAGAHKAPRTIDAHRSSGSVRERDAAARAADARRAAAEEKRGREAALRRARYEREIRRIKEYERAAKREHTAAKRRETALVKAQRKRAETELLRREIKVERRSISVPFIVTVVIAFVLLMGVIYSFSEVASSSAELSDIKTRLSEVQTESDKLTLKLEEKNDLGAIEKRATEELMMVSENSVEKKYISVSGGDRVVLENSEEKSSEGFLGGLLSSFSTAIDGFLDYLR